MEHAENEEPRWHVLNLRYVRAASVSPQLEEEGMRTFVPPVVSNLLFAHDTETRLKDFIARKPVGSKLSLMRSRGTGKPIVVREADMDLFMRICAALEAPIVMTERPELKTGDHVRIKEGPLKGAEGDVVRMKKNKRVLINIGNVLWVATDYLKPEQLEVIPQEH